MELFNKILLDLVRKLQCEQKEVTQGTLVIVGTSPSFLLFFCLDMFGLGLSMNDCEPKLPERMIRAPLAQCPANNRLVSN